MDSQRPWLWPMTLKTFPALHTHVMKICGKFQEITPLSKEISSNQTRTDTAVLYSEPHGPRTSKPQGPQTWILTTLAPFLRHFAIWHIWPRLGLTVHCQIRWYKGLRAHPFPWGPSAWRAQGPKHVKTPLRTDNPKHNVSTTCCWQEHN